LLEIKRKKERMSITIIQSKDESLAKRFFELNVSGAVEFICEPADWSKVLVSQNSLFAITKPEAFCFYNMLDKKFTKEVTALEKQASTQKLFFLQFGKAKVSAPKWLMSHAKVYDLDQLARSFSFWQKIAAKIKVDIDYDEWQKATAILGKKTHFLFSVLEQKSLAPQYPLDFFVANWPEGNIFKLIDAIDQKNSAEALRILQLFWQTEEKPGLIWNMLVRHFVQLKQIKDGAKVAMHPYARSQAQKALSHYQGEELTKILDRLSSLDIKSKTGYLEGNQKERELIYLLLFSQLFLAAQSEPPVFWQPEI
jgi:DNA polymerase III delta subunit